MQSLQDEEQRQVLLRFFKTGKGDYGEGDKFLGLRVPQTREVVKLIWKDFPLSEIPILLRSPWHEVRLCGLLVMVYKFEFLTTKRLVSDVSAAKERDRIVEMYLNHAHCANNWDLVDLSAPEILGAWLLLPCFMQGGKLDEHREEKLKLLDRLAVSDNLWLQRISMVCTWKTSQAGDPFWCLRYAEIHLHHTHDLMHKAVGWMLREVGKRVDMELLRHFLQQHAATMPRTALRYAIEKMSEEERKKWMSC